MSANFTFEEIYLLTRRHHIQNESNSALQQLWQLRDVGGDPTRFVVGQAGMTTGSNAVAAIGRSAASVVGALV
jgi:hypothetical protein